MPAKANASDDVDRARRTECARRRIRAAYDSAHRRSARRSLRPDSGRRSARESHEVFANNAMCKNASRLSVQAGVVAERADVDKDKVGDLR